MAVIPESGFRLTAQCKPAFVKEAVMPGQKPAPQLPDTGFRMFH